MTKAPPLEDHLIKPPNFDVQAAPCGSPAVHAALKTAIALYESKNTGYRSTADPMANFRESAPVAKGLLTPLQYAFVLMSKQDDAVSRLVWAHAQASHEGCDTGSEGRAEYAARGGDVMLRERLMDGIVYRAILIALLGDPAK